MNWLGEIAGSPNGNGNGEHTDPSADGGSATLPDPKTTAETQVEEHKQRQRGETQPPAKKTKRRRSHNPQHAKLIANIEALRKGANDQVKRLDAALKELRKGTH